MYLRPISRRELIGRREISASTRRRPALLHVAPDRARLSSRRNSDCYYFCFRSYRQFFENKQKLFVAAVDVPVDPAELVAHILAGDLDSIGKRIARTFLEPPLAVRCQRGPRTRY